MLAFALLRGSNNKTMILFEMQGAAKGHEENKKFLRRSFIKKINK